MALANHRVRAFPSPSALEQFIINDAAILTVVRVFSDNSGQYILVYTV